MYVCNCNGITEKQLHEAIDSGISRWSDIHTYYDCEPQCGKCEREIADAIINKITKIK